jgi:hypothetical protein
MNKISIRDRQRIIFNAVYLDNPSLDKLKSIYTGIHPNYFGEHVTINFGVNEAPENLGETVSIDVVGYAKDEKGEAVVVKLPFETSKENLHITISTANGIKPVYSNALLINGFEKIQPFTLTGVVASFMQGGHLEVDRNKL